MAEVFQPASSNIAQATYDEASKELTVEFVTGNSYRYTNVPQETWFGLQHAQSAGKYFWRNIRERFPTQQV